MASKFRNAGQVCIASNRVLVQAGIHDKFVAKLKETVEKSMVLGDGMDQGVNQVDIILNACLCFKNSNLVEFSFAGPTCE